ncbi:MAG TPA: trehalase-like domain-containing protein, partial [Chryseosolibacter sp.]
MAKHQYNMGVVGNCSYMAYIDTHASIKWMCMPRFDSSFLFGSLLDSEKGGEFSITPSGDFTSTQHYIPNTNVLVTEFTTPQGRFRVIDCAPRFYQFERFFKPLMLVRKIELLEGNPVITVKCKPVGNYGEMQSQTVVSSNHLRFLHYDMP